MDSAGYMGYDIVTRTSGPMDMSDAAGDSGPVVAYDVTELARDYNKAMGLDPVNHPAHYTEGAVECIDAIEASMTREEYLGYLKGNVIKYMWRWRRKGGVTDLEKARWYLERMLG